jgi:hypothetical protein
MSELQPDSGLDSGEVGRRMSSAGRRRSEILVVSEVYGLLGNEWTGKDEIRNLDA